MKAYLARVYRNSNFGINGTIDVLLIQQTEQQGLRDEARMEIYESPKKLINNILPSEMDDEVLEIQNLTQTCAVMGQMGYGKNSGEFSIPQIGSLGLVIEIGDIANTFGTTKYAWLGGFYGNKKYGNTVSLPSDDTSDDLDDTDEPLETDVTDEVAESEYIKKGMKIIKTKTCCVDDYETVTSNKLNYEKIPTDNTFVLRKDKSALRHNTYTTEDEEQTTTVTNEDGTITETTEIVTNYIKTAIGQLEIKDNSISLYRKSKEDEVTSNQKLTFNSDKSITITNYNDADEPVEISIQMGSDGVMNILSSNNMKISTAKNLDIHGDTINIVADSGLNITNRNKFLTIGDGDVSLIQVISDILDFLTRFKTIGNQANQYSSPENVKDTNQILKDMLSGFDTSVVDNGISHS